MNESPPTSALSAPEDHSRDSVENGSQSAVADASEAGGVVLDDASIRRALLRIAHEIVEAGTEIPSLYLVAIPNGGVPLARILVENLTEITGFVPRIGLLDTTLYRDDLVARGTRPPLRKTEMPSSVDDRVVILVEDVVNTGRTIRAAMDALMDFGRPRVVRLVALVDRGHRELPIRIDHVGKNIPTNPTDKVVFRVRNDGEEILEVILKEQPDGDTGIAVAPQGEGE